MTYHSLTYLVISAPFHSSKHPCLASELNGPPGCTSLFWIGDDGPIPMLASRLPTLRVRPFSPLTKGQQTTALKAKNGFYIFERWKKQRICDRVNMPPAKSNLLPGPLQYICAHPYSLPSGGGRRPVPSSQSFYHRLFPLRLGVEAGPFSLIWCEGWRLVSSPFLSLLLQSGDSARTSLKDISLFISLSTLSTLGHFLYTSAVI